MSCAARTDPEGRVSVFRDRARRRPNEVGAFIDMHRDRFGVEPNCRTLDVSASACYQRATGERSARRIEDERLTGRIREVHEANYDCYGHRRTHAALVRQGETAGRDQVARLMASDGLQGAKRRGKPWKTTTPDPEAQRASDLVKRDFTATAQDRLWVGDFERHEVLCDRAVMKGHRLRFVAADW